MFKKSKKEISMITPIKEPQKIYMGQVLFMILVSKITKSQTSFQGKAIGDQIQYAAINEIKVRTLELNEGETGLIINKATENIRVDFNPERNKQEGDGSLFDDEKKAQAVAAAINSVNKEKCQVLREEINAAESFLNQLLEKGA